MAERSFNVLFLCTGNSARSIMAEAILAREGKDKFKAFSAGSFPKGEVHPYAIKLLKTMGYETDEFRSKSWDEFSDHRSPKMDFVFTVCDSASNELCPIWPGKPITAHWGIPDPATTQGTEAGRRLVFTDAFKMLKIASVFL
jgi:protein-tyrosine-phosphatase